MTDENPSNSPPGEPPLAPRPEGAAGGYQVVLPTFEGPLDLLLHLIEQHELDIRDIPIAFVAAKYVEYITLMDELNIDIASEYLVMAATLIHIKSKMLLPVQPSDQDEDDEEGLDPRAELVRRLLEYQKYKLAAEQLGGGDVLGRDVFVRGLPAPAVEGPAPLAGLSLFKLLDAFQGVLSRTKVQVDHQIDFERFSITDRINQLVDLLQRFKRCTFEQLFEGASSRGELIVTFLALLEMTRLRMTRLEQAAPLEPITIELALVDPGMMEEAAVSAEASFSPRPADDEIPEEPDVDDEDDNALATRRGDAAPATPSIADEIPELAELEPEDENHEP
ncbi:MAG: Segregation and condensation protein [Polyangiaceae bacterium]|jgi:segregation and condensation protein A|nr:Segregation and condensation protein [Polyangiaceae bacterium]